jgi:CheY-like chemotaxis protein
MTAAKGVDMKWRSPRVLVIDDNPADQMLAKLAFEESALDVEFHSASTCAEGIGQLRRCLDEGNCPDLVLVDLNLVDGSGYEVLSALRQARTDEELTAVVLTTSSDPQDQSRAMHLGASAYLVKPNSFLVFMDMVHGLAGHLRRHA